MTYKTYTYTTTAPEPVHWGFNEYKEYKVRVDEMQKWCNENMEHWGFSSAGNGNHEFWFANQGDYMLFLLRWA